MTWAPTVNQVGNFSVALQVDDGRGGSAEQDFVLTITAPVPNRPPVFTSDPIVDANVNVRYVYQATAFDPDYDPLTFSVVTGPTGLSIGQHTGTVQWTPTDSQLGVQDVTLQVDDSNGGTATQAYSILVQIQPGDHPPIIVSQPVTQYHLPGVSHPATNNVQPQHIALTLSAGDVATTTVALTLTHVVPQTRGIFTAGDILAAVTEVGINNVGYINHFSADGTFLGVLDPQFNGYATGMAFDASSNLYSTGFGTNLVETFDSSGNLLQPFGSNLYYPESVVFDHNGIVYVSSARLGPNSGIHEFDQHGNLLGVILSGTRVDWMDLAADQRTMLYTDEGDNIHSVDVVTGLAGPDFNKQPVGGSTALRILPDGGVLVACQDDFDVTHLNKDGNIVQTYSVPGQLDWFAVTLDPDGTSFWSGDSIGGVAYKFDIASGQLLEELDTYRGAISAANGFLGGLTVYGEITAATVYADVDVVATDSGVSFVNLTGVLPGTKYGQTDSFTTQITGDGVPHSFDLLFVQAGTGNVLGSLPVTINVPPYVYPVHAIDPDGDPVTYSMPIAPAGATIDPQSGRIDWKPDAVGTYHFRVEVSDGRGGRDSQQYDVVVDGGAANHDPVISSSAPTQAMVSRAYSYPLTATDPDGDTLSYYLTAAPAGMTIDGNTGAISWTPTADEIGPQTVTVQVRDSRGGLVNHSFTVTVAPNAFANRLPQFSSTPGTNGVVANVYQYHAMAFDPDGDPLTFDLPVHPNGMAVDPVSGIVVWRPTSDEVGVQSVLLASATVRVALFCKAILSTYALSTRLRLSRRSPLSSRSPPIPTSIKSVPKMQTTTV